MRALTNLLFCFCFVFTNCQIYEFEDTVIISVTPEATPYEALTNNEAPVEVEETTRVEEERTTSFVVEDVTTENFNEVEVPTEVFAVGKNSIEQNSTDCTTTQGDDGLCVKFKDCYPFLFSVKDSEDPTSESDELSLMLRLNAGQCGKEKNYICCSWMKMERKYPQLPIDFKPLGGKPPGVKKSCGTLKHVVNGSPASKGQFPFMAALMNNGRQFCGGSLIDSRHILTAAHCVKTLNADSARKIRIHLGDYNIYNANDGPFESHQAERIFYNRGFSFQTLNNDVAVIKLTRHAGSGQNIKSICMMEQNAEGIFGRKDAMVVGWGKQGTQRPQSTVPNYASVPIWNQRNCQDKYRRLAQMQNSMVCAGGRGKDSCQGDSGGPLIVWNGRNYEQLGIVSFGVDCGEAPGYYPGVYTRVDSFIQWIKKNQNM